MSGQDETTRLQAIRERTKGLRCQPAFCHLDPLLCAACQAAEDAEFLLSALEAARQEIASLSKDLLVSQLDHAGTKAEVRNRAEDYGWMMGEREKAIQRAESAEVQVDTLTRAQAEKETHIETYRRMDAAVREALQAALPDIDGFSTVEAIGQLRATVDTLTAALKSIANSSCCGCCQEAAMVAKSALHAAGMA